MGCWKMSNMVFLYHYEAEKLKKQIWIQYCGTPRILMPHNTNSRSVRLVTVTQWQPHMITSLQNVVDTAPGVNIPERAPLPDLHRSWGEIWWWWRTSRGVCDPLHGGIRYQQDSLGVHTAPGGKDCGGEGRNHQEFGLKCLALGPYTKTKFLHPLFKW